MYFHDIGDKGLGAAVDARLLGLVDRWSQKKFKLDATWRAALVNKADNQWAKKNSGDADLQGTSNTPRDWRLWRVSLIGIRRVREIRAQLLLMLRDSNGTDVAEEHCELVIGGRHVVAFKGRAYLSVLFCAHIGSEYCLPYLVAFIPPLYVFCQMSVR
ncbi:MAG: hypothetical protein ACYDEV_03870 [Acidiferrobacter sp.]